MFTTLPSAPCKSHLAGTTRSASRHIAQRVPTLRSTVIVRAADDADAELEKRLEKLRQVKGATPYGQGKARSSKESGAPAPGAKAAAPAKVEYDFTNEKVHWEGNPAAGDLALNVALGTTLVWLPLTAAAVGRVVFVKYRFTDKRFSVMTNAPWKQEQTDVAYQEVKEVVTVGRALGFWGDMVVTLNNGDKIELRSLEKFKELKDYILERRDALVAASGGRPAAPATPSKAKGAMVTAAELMGEPEPEEAKKKGFGF